MFITFGSSLSIKDVKQGNKGEELLLAGCMLRVAIDLPIKNIN
jgi:hypothetical protein